MKKRIALLLAGVLAVTSLVACGGGNQGGNNNDAAAKVKVGLGACTSFSESYSIGEDNHGQAATATNAQVDIHVAAVTLNADNTIADIQIDAIQIKNSVDANGALAADAKKEFTSKHDLGEDYGMKAYGPEGAIGVEWCDQIDNFETWAKGKTLEEINAGIGTDGYPTDATLKSGCTIQMNDIKAAVADAIEKAVETDATTADTLGIAIIGEMTKEANATATDAGTFQAYVNFACTTQNAEGKITSVLIDSIQAYPTWGADGILTTDAEQDVRTKYTKKYEYGMKEYGPEGAIGKEWFEQIDVFKQTILGATAAEVEAIAVNDAGNPTDETLLTGCTMKISAYKTVVVKSLAK